MRSPAAGAAGPAGCVALAVHAGRGRRRPCSRCAVLQNPRCAPPFGRRGARGGRHTAESYRLRSARAGCVRGNIDRLGAGLCPGLAVGGRRQFRHAALGAPPVPGGRAVGAPAPGHALRRSGLRLVPGAARRRQGTEALVRLPRFPPRTGARRRPPDAAGDRRGGDAGRARSRHSADRNRQIALLSDSGAVALRQDRRTHGRYLAAGRADEGSGRRAGGARDRRVRDRQRAALDAGAGRRAGPGPPRRRRNFDYRAGAIALPFGAPGARPARDRRLGAGRGALSVALGARFPAGLSLCRPLHPGEGGRRPGSAGAVPDRDGQARRGGRHNAAFPRSAGHRVDGIRRRGRALQPRLRRDPDLRRRKIR